MRTKLAIFIAALLSLSMPSAPAVADGGGYQLTWYSIDGGGATFSTGGAYQLGGSIGQPDAGTSSGGGYTLVGGFWSGAAIEYKVYLPAVLKGY